MRRLTKFVVRSASVAALLALALVVPAQARADCVTPSGTLNSIPLSADGSLRAFSGNVAPFGQITGVLQIHVNHLGAFTGQFAFTTSAGTAYGIIHGQFLSGNTYVESLTFTGGTGSYTGISGYATVSGMLNLTTGTGMDTVLGGQICLP